MPVGKLAAFLGSAAIGALLVANLVPSSTASLRAAATPANAMTPVAVLATPRPEPEVALPVAAVEVPTWPSEAVATRTVPHPSRPAAASTRHGKVKAPKALTRAARAAYLRGDLESAEHLLRYTGQADQASVVASTRSFLTQADIELRAHDEAAATRAFEAAARADRALGFGTGKVARDIGRQLGLLHMAAGLRARRAGDESHARQEFAAAHRADPLNRRASLELGSPGVAPASDFIDPE